MDLSWGGSNFTDQGLIQKLNTMRYVVAIKVISPVLDFFLSVSGEL